MQGAIIAVNYARPFILTSNLIDHSNSNNQTIFSQLCISGNTKSKYPQRLYISTPFSSNKQRRALGSVQKMYAANRSQAALSKTLPNGVTEHKLTFKNPKGELLVGYFVDTGSSKVVLLCHGYMANHTMCNFPALAAALAAVGLSSFRFDHPCAWRGESEIHGPFLMGNHDDEVADMGAAAEFMRKEHGQTVVALLGHSKGGTNVIQYAAEVGDIPKIINLSGRFFVRQGVLQRVS